MELYQWQKDAVNAWIEQDTRGIADVITGAGKTVLALACAQYLRNRYPVRVRIVVPTVPLALQWKQAIQNWFVTSEFNDEIGLYYGEKKDHSEKPFMIYVINSARYAISRHILFDMKKNLHCFLIADECHRYTGECNSLIFRFQTSEQYRSDLYHCLGLSATPQCRLYESVLIPSLGQICFHYDVAKAAHDCTVSPFHIIHTAVPFTGKELKSYSQLTEMIRTLFARLLKQDPSLAVLSETEFFHIVSQRATEDSESLEAQIDGRIRKRRKLLYEAENRTLCVIDLLLTQQEEEKVLLFCERIEQAEQLYQLLNIRFPGKAGHYHSEMTASMRKHCLSMFREGEYRFLVTCRALDEGLDVPDAGVGIVVSSGSISRQRIQRLGRVLRRSLGKQSARLYYLYVPHTVENPCYLDGTEEETAELVYLPNEHSFICNTYEALAMKLLKQKKNASAAVLKELRRCIQKGIARTDWMLEEEQLDTLISQCESKAERNYYLCMKELSILFHHNR